jgi:hypothetical protein
MARGEFSTPLLTSGPFFGETRYNKEMNKSTGYTASEYVLSA